MFIRLITLTYNEEKIMPFFLNHYLRFVNEIIVYDNESTDNTVEIVKSYPHTKVRINKSKNVINDLRYLSIKNNAWKYGRHKFDWQIVVDVDEFLYHPNFLEELEVYSINNVSVVPTIGYNMMSFEFPSDYNGHIFDKIKMGVRAPGYGKTCIFNPNKIQEINYAPGAHFCRPVGDVVVGYPSFKLLHYKYFGYEHWKEKNDLYVSRLGEERDGYADAYLLWKNEVNSEKDFYTKFEYNKMQKVLD